MYALLFLLIQNRSGCSSMCGEPQPDLISLINDVVDDHTHTIQINKSRAAPVIWLSALFPDPRSLPQMRGLPKECSLVGLCFPGIGIGGIETSEIEKEEETGK